MTALISAILAYLVYVESGGNPAAVGDRGRAVGLYQIHPIYVADVNRIAGTFYTLSDRTDPAKSREMVMIYLRHYGERYERITGKKATLEILAAIHNGGPDGWKKPKSIAYAKRSVK
ncbi:MAG: transglycosylase SLT domain-containing protein [Lentisphaeria bacterium]|nr:transglycosylase SLT domain-containing protein [Lentisphaeria bacterium]